MKEKKTRKKRQKPEVVATTVEPPKKRGRKPRADKHAANGQRSTKVDLSVAFTALSGLKVEDAKLVSRLAAHLGNLPKRSRSRIVQALSHIFA